MQTHIDIEIYMMVHTFISITKIQKPCCLVQAAGLCAVKWALAIRLPHLHVHTYAVYHIIQTQYAHTHAQVESKLPRADGRCEYPLTGARVTGEADGSFRTRLAVVPVPAAGEWSDSSCSCTARLSRETEEASCIIPYK